MSPLSLNPHRRVKGHSGGREGDAILADWIGEKRVPGQETFSRPGATPMTVVFALPPVKETKSPNRMKMMILRSLRERLSITSATNGRSIPTHVSPPESIASRELLIETRLRATRGERGRVACRSAAKCQDRQSVVGEEKDGEPRIHTNVRHERPRRRFISHSDRRTWAESTRGIGKSRCQPMHKNAAVASSANSRISPTWDRRISSTIDVEQFPLRIHMTLGGKPRTKLI